MLGCCEMTSRTSCVTFAALPCQGLCSLLTNQEFVRLLFGLDCIRRRSDQSRGPFFSSDLFGECLKTAACLLLEHVILMGGCRGGICADTSRS